MSRYSNGALFAVVVAILLQIYFRNFNEPSGAAFVRRTRAPTQIYGNQNSDDEINSDIRYCCDGSKCGYRNVLEPADSDVDASGRYPCSLSDNSIWAYGDLAFTDAKPKRISSNWGWRNRISLGSNQLQPLYAGWIGNNPNKGLRNAVGYANITYTSDTLYVQLISINGCPMFCKVSIYAEFKEMCDADYDGFTIFGSKPKGLRNACESCTSDENDEDGGCGNENSRCMQQGMCGRNGVPTKCTGADTGNVLYKIDLTNVQKPAYNSDIFLAIRSRYSSKACQCVPILITSTVTGPTTTYTTTATSWGTTTETSVSVTTYVTTSTVVQNDTITVTTTSPTTLTSTYTTTSPTTLYITGPTTTTTSVSYVTATTTSTSVSYINVVSTVTKTVNVYPNDTITIVFPSTVVTQPATCSGYVTALTFTLSESSYTTTAVRNYYGTSRIMPITIPAAVLTREISTFLRGTSVVCTATVNNPAVTTTTTITVTSDRYNTITQHDVSTMTQTVTVTSYSATPFTVYYPGATVTSTVYATTTVGSTVVVVTVTETGTPTTYTSTRFSTETVYATTTYTITPTPTTSTVYPNTIPTCLNFGVAAGANAYLSGNYEGSSDVEGRLVVGGNVTLAAGFSIGDKLTGVDMCREITFVVGDTLLSWPSGRNYFGSVNLRDANHGAVSSSILTQDDHSVCLNYYDPSFFDFNLANSRLVTLSTNLAALSVTATWTVTDTVMNIVLQGGLDIEIVDVIDSLTFISQVKSIAMPANYKQGSLIVFNVHGSSSGFKGGDMEQLKDLNVLFNFFQATSLVINDVAVRGWVLAPLATTLGATGVVWGSIFMKKLTGSLQINLRQIPLCTTTEQTQSTWMFQFPAQANSQTSAGYAGGAVGEAWMLVLLMVLFMDFML